MIQPIIDLPPLIVSESVSPLELEPAIPATISATLQNPIDFCPHLYADCTVTPMQDTKSKPTAVSEVDLSDGVQKSVESEELDGECIGGNANGDSILDLSGKSLDFSEPKRMEDSVQGLYVYKNVYNLIPRWLSGHRRLKTLKYFGNEVNLFPAEFSSLIELECLQLKISAPSLTGLPLEKLKALKELELSQVPPRPSAFQLLSEIAGLRCLKKLSICHFSIRYLPPEIGYLTKLEYLDLSFNKLRNLPSEIAYLTDLISLKASNNKLVELPSGLSNLLRLEILDLSNNRLATLGCLDLGSMRSLRKLNLQYNTLISCQVPSWVCCDMEGNGEQRSNDELVSAAVEMDVFEDNLQVFDDSASQEGAHIPSSNHSTATPSSSRCFAARRPGKGWKRRYYLQQRARQERLNSSRKLRCEDHAEPSTQKASDNCNQCKPSILHEVNAKSSSSAQAAKIDNKESHTGDVACKISSIKDDDISSEKKPCDDYCSSASANSVEIGKTLEYDCTECDTSLDAILDVAQLEDVRSSSALCNSTPKSKRHSDGGLDNPKPSKYPRSADDHGDLCCKYNNLSFCGIDDLLPDGFYDAGRDRPFMSLRNYEQYLHLDSREVILLDRNRDEDLDAIVLCAQSLVSHFKQMNVSTGESEQFAIDNLQIASLLAMFVSDHFGGSDRSALIERVRKAVSGSNYRKPFVCSCSTGNSDRVTKSIKHAPDTSDDVGLFSLCERGLQSIKAKRDSVVVPIGTLQFGVCRHRALLMKYLCDRMEPRVPCELVRGYLDFSPHAWNIVAVRRGDAWVRMIVDACHPHDIRQETDTEYYCRYIPLSRMNVPHLTNSGPEQSCSFPSLSTCDEIEKAPSSSLIRCDFGSVEAVAKVREHDIDGISAEEMKKFEYSCLGEVRILSALSRHSCIVEIYGHQISAKWVESLDKDTKRRKLQSAILMEYIGGGSLKNYIEKLSDGGEKYVPVELSLYIARDIASALVELHSNHIIHRDIKSENILVDMDRRRPDGTPLVKLCDFDRAVPLRSYLHSCCIAHIGIPPPNVCVGTPRWMAPEVFRSMHDPEMYGLEVDIWSFGCMLLELLTLKVPYSGLSELEINDLLKMGERPPLPDEIEALGLHGETEMAQTDDGTEEELETLRFLVQIYRKCTVNNPIDRPTAENLYDMLVDRTTSFLGSRSSEEK